MRCEYVKLVWIVCLTANFFTLLNRVLNRDFAPKKKKKKCKNNVALKVVSQKIGCKLAIIVNKVENRIYTKILNLNLALDRGEEIGRKSLNKCNSLNLIVCIWITDLTLYSIHVEKIHCSALLGKSDNYTDARNEFLVPKNPLIHIFGRFDWTLGVTPLQK